MEYSKIIRYFRDCYDADNRRTTFWNIFHPTIEHRIFCTGKEDLLTGDFPRITIDPTRGTAASQAASLYRKEKTLLYCSLFLIGSIETEENPHQLLCTPLLMHPATFDESENGHLFLRIDTANRQWNYRVLDEIQQSERDTTLYQRLADTVGLQHIREQEIGDIIATAQCYVPSLDCTALYKYPDLLPEKNVLLLLKAEKQKSETALSLVPASALVLIKKPVGTRGILNELSALAQTPLLSAPLQTLLGYPNIPQGKNDSQYTRYSHIPATLSPPQKRILASASQHPLTVAIGPPGTGKSFTIACIAAEHISQGKSVLIASQMDQALDVIADKLENQLALHGCSVRAGKQHYLRDLKKRLEYLLNGTSLPNTLAYKQLSKQHRRLAALESRSTAIEQHIQQQQEWELKHAPLFAQPPMGMVRSLWRRFLLWRVRQRKTLSALHAELEEVSTERSCVAAQYTVAQHAENTASTLGKHRKEFIAFLQAIRARTGNRQQQLFQSINFHLLFRVFPLWLVKLSDIHDILPLEQELFGIAIIDEASQCDIASSIPIIQRAKRVLIVGDPHQQRHDIITGTAYSFQGEERDTMFISFAADHTAHHSRMRWLNKQDAFNVSITRARHHQHIYTSLPTSTGITHSLADKYFHYIGALSAKQPLSPTVPDEQHPLIQHLQQALLARGFASWVHYPIAHYVLDLIAVCSTRCIGLDLIGFPHQQRKHLSTAHYQMLRRAGVQCIPIAFSEWHNNPDGCIEQTLRYCGIQPL